MAKYKRYRSGSVAHIVDSTGTIHEYRVGPVPPPDGSGYRNARGADYVEIRKALNQVRTEYVLLSLYIRRDSQSKGFRWISSPKRRKKDLLEGIDMMHKLYLSPAEMAERIGNYNFPISKVLAWNFTEVY